MRKQKLLSESGCSCFKIEVYCLYPNKFTIWWMHMLFQKWSKDHGLVPLAQLSVPQKLLLQLSTSAGTTRTDCYLFLNQLSSPQEPNPMFAQVDWKFPLVSEDIVSKCRMILTAKNWGSITFKLFRSWVYFSSQALLLVPFYTSCFRCSQLLLDLVS